MNITHLEYFLTASRTLNYTQAAKRLFTSRQNLTHGIRELERELGVSLFAQDKGKLVLTAEGEEAAGMVAGILNDVERFKLAFADAEAGDEPLSVIVMSNIFSFTPYDVASVFDRAPRGKLRIGELNCEECYENVVSGGFDLALVACMDRDFPECESMVLHRDHLYFLLSDKSPLAAKRSLTLSDLGGQAVQMPPGYEFMFDPLIRKLRERNYSSENIYPIATFSMVRRMAARGEAMGIASALFENNSPEGTVALPLFEEGTEVSLRVIYRKDTAKMSEVRRFVEDLAHSVPESQREPRR